MSKYGIDIFAVIDKQIIISDYLLYNIGRHMVLKIHSRQLVLSKMIHCAKFRLTSRTIPQLSCRSNDATPGGVDYSSTPIYIFHT